MSFYINPGPFGSIHTATDSVGMLTKFGLGQDKGKYANNYKGNHRDIWHNRYQIFQFQPSKILRLDKKT